MTVIPHCFLAETNRCGVTLSEQIVKTAKGVLASAKQEVKYISTVKVMLMLG